MSDPSNPPVITTPTSPPLMNDPNSRSPDGTIKDQSLPPTSTPTPKPEPDPNGTLPPPDPKPAEPGPKPDATGAPDKYEAFTAPDGYTVDAAAIDAAVPIFRDLNLTQAQSQRLVDFYNTQMIAAAKAPSEAVETMRESWRNATKADADITKAVTDGKSGIDAVKIDIGRALAHLPSAEATAFKEAMDLTGAGDHPAIVKGYWRFAQMVNEGKHVNGGGPSPHGQSKTGVAAKPSAAQAMYPTLPSSAQG